MKRFWLALLLILPAQVFAYSGIRDVTVFQDDGTPELYGSLRRVLEGACMEAGDDVIVFHHTSLTEIRIFLRAPLVIPANCNGSVTLRGSSEVETILDGSLIENGEAILILQSWGDTIDGLTFVAARDSAGISVQGNDHILQNNFIGTYRNAPIAAGNQKGILLKGDWNRLEQNTITANREEGVLVEGDANLLIGNNIGTRAGSCPEAALPAGGASAWPTLIHEIITETLMPNPMMEGPTRDAVCGNGGSGIKISGSRNVIGNFASAHFAFDPFNQIHFNHDRGIVVQAQAQRNLFVRNSLAYNRGLGIDLEGSANQNIAPIQNLQIFPPESEVADPHYHLTGQGVPGTTLDLYLIAKDDPNDSEGKGEGAHHVHSFDIVDENFSFDFTSTELSTSMKLAAIACDAVGNCSEFSNRAVMSLDSDQDSIPDAIEDENANNRVETIETDAYLIDSDGEGLPDSVEDRNGNGLIEDGETDPRKSDSDEDGLSDFLETGGDGRFDAAEGDTDPLAADSDRDGRPDGTEDANHDGVLNIGESDPRVAG